jgi:3',5'-nucleoside bisphosphate phosphatase
LNQYRADLHIHSLLSPCGSLEMSPAAIVTEACNKGLDIIGITDHNSTRQASLIKYIGEKNGLFVLCGAEVTTREEAHCLVFLPDQHSLAQFQDYLDQHLPPIPNHPDLFGFQVVVNELEEIIHEEQNLLLSAIDQSVEQVEQKAHELGGIYIAAHINKAKNSLISQLGFVPPDLKLDALELSKHITLEKFITDNAYLKNYTFIRSSDAHIPEDIGSAFSVIECQKRSFEEIKLAFAGKDGRRIITK